MNGRNMGGRSMNVRYRNSSYTKKRVKVIVTISALTLAVIAVALLIIGNVLRASSDEKKEQPIGSENDAVIDAGSDVPSANGYSMSLSSVNSGTNTLNTYINRAKGLGGNVLSFAARDTSGRELYSSELAVSMGKQSGSGRVSLRDIERGTGSSLRTSAGVNVSAFGESDAIYRSVLLAYDAGICAELYEGGVDDVFIRLTSGQVNSESIDAVLNFADSVKKINPSVTIGIALGKGFFALADADTLIDRLSDRYDFLLYDLTDYTSASGDAIEYVRSNVDTAQLYIMMYDMRVMIPLAEDAIIADMVAALRSKSIDNWQVYMP